MPNSKNNNTLKILFVGITLAVIGVRLGISFSHELILGANGGYYPLQVRKVLTTGFLGFKDLPLYFYFCAAWLKLFSFFGFALSNQNIISVIKVIDSVALPLLAIPLFFLINNSEKRIPTYAAVSILVFAIFSYSPLAMLGDIQKNASAIPLAFLFFSLIQQYLNLKEKKSLIWALFVLVLIGITHFGVFTFTVAFAIILLLVVYRKKAILPAIISLILAFGIIAMFDLERALRLLYFWKAIFENRFIFRNPLFPIILLNTLCSYFLCAFAWFQYRKFKSQLSKSTNAILIALIIVIFVFAFPLYEANYVIRFQALLFIPQSLLIFYLIKINNRLAISISMILLLFTLVCTLLYFKQRHQPAIDYLAYQDLQNLKKHFSKEKDSTIVVAKHGLEFWTAFALDVKVANDRGMQSLNQAQYKSVIVLNMKEKTHQRPDRNRPMEGPQQQNKGKLLYSSAYFDAFELKNKN